MKICQICLISLMMAGMVNAASVSDYNIVWDSPSKDSNGTMPLGNGDISLNAWVGTSGDLLFYIGKTDAWSDNARLLKVGKVRITLDPAPPVSPFKQELVLEQGTMVVKYGDGTVLRLWVDANHPVIHVDTEGPSSVTATASIELWRTNQVTLRSLQCSDVMMHAPKGELAPTVVEPDTIITGSKNRIGWYHHNIKSVGPEQHARIQGVTGYKREDPLLHRTFGAVITTPNAKSLDDTRLQSAAGKSHRFDVHVLTKHPASPEEWLKSIDSLIDKTDSASFKKRRKAHEKWWSDFWGRSWIHVSQGEPIDGKIIPDSNHTIKIGHDQSGRNRYSGKVGRVSVFKRALTPEEIAVLAKDDKTALKEQIGLVKSWTDVAVGNALSEVTKKDLAGSVSMEAWIQPNGGTARIIDMITPGGQDGFLLDTSRNNLRFIVGSTIISKANCLPVGKWSHVAAVADAVTGHLSVYANGNLVAESNVTKGNDAFIVARSYALQRFIDAGAGRGAYPIKFNGSIFTAPHGGDPDYRRWGPGYWWQNTRLPYLSMCAAGDYDLMQPLVDMYVDRILPLNKYRTRHYFNHGGAYFAECIHFWGDVFNECYGWTPMEKRKDPLQTSGWHKWEWVAGPELAFMLMDYYDYTLDEKFLKEKVLPLTIEVLKYFDEHYKTTDKGELVMHPAMACETWWDCTNPMPELAGLHGLTKRMLALTDKQLGKDSRKFCEQLQKKLPPLPTRKVGGKDAFAPATKFANKRNCENPELYVVFPFRLASFEKDNADLGVQALNHRWDRGAFGWRQDDIFMAYLGLADQAKRNLVSRSRNYHRASRFPAFWGPNYDWVPDQDHGGVMMKALQAMILQPDPYSRKVYVAPAWPKDWNCEFKLHAPYKTTIEGKVKDGKVVDLKVTPKSRRKDVVVVGEERE